MKLRKAETEIEQLIMERKSLIRDANCEITKADHIISGLHQTRRLPNVSVSRPSLATPSSSSCGRQLPDVGLQRPVPSPRKSSQSASADLTVDEEHQAFRTKAAQHNDLDDVTKSRIDHELFESLSTMSPCELMETYKAVNKYRAPASVTSGDGNRCGVSRFAF